MKITKNISTIKTLLFLFSLIICVKLICSLLVFIPTLGPECPNALAITGSNNTNITPPPKNLDDNASEIQPKVLEILRATIRNNIDEQKKLAEEKAALQSLKTDITDKINELKQLQSVLSQPAQKAQKANKARFDHLVSVYSAMDPQRAALLLDKLDTTTVAKIFATMKSRKVAKILALMKPDKAAKISAILSQKKFSVR